MAKKNREEVSLTGGVNKNYAATATTKKNQNMGGWTIAGPSKEPKGCMVWPWMVGIAFLLTFIGVIMVGVGNDGVGMLSSSAETWGDCMLSLNLILAVFHVLLSAFDFLEYGRTGIGSYVFGCVEYLLAISDVTLICLLLVFLSMIGGIFKPDVIK